MMGDGMVVGCSLEGSLDGLRWFVGCTDLITYVPKRTSQCTPLILPPDKRKGPVSHVLNGITDSWDICMFECIWLPDP